MARVASAIEHSSSSADLLAESDTGYLVWAACPCGGSWEWWVSVAEVIGDLDVDDAWRALAET